MPRLFFNCLSLFMVSFLFKFFFHLFSSRIEKNPIFAAAMIKGTAKYDLLKSVAHCCASLCLCIIALIRKIYNKTVVFMDGVRIVDWQSMDLVAASCLKYSIYSAITYHRIGGAVRRSLCHGTACRLVGPFFEFLVLSS